MITRSLILGLIGNIIIPIRTMGGECLMKLPSDSEALLKAELAKTLGYNVHKYRTAARLTQEELAEKVGIGASFITRIECGQKIMSVPVLYKIAKSLHVSVDMLLSEKDEVPSSERLLNIINSCSPESVHQVESILRICLSIIES